MNDLIKEVALAGAEKFGVVAEDSEIVDLVTWCIAELSKRAEAVAKVQKYTGSLKDMAIIVWTNEQPPEGTKLFTFQPIHDIEPALSRYRRNTEGEDEPGPIERLRFFLSLALHGQDWIDVEPFINDIEAIENRVAEACASVAKERKGYRASENTKNALDDVIEVIRSGEWRNCK